MTAPSPVKPSYLGLLNAISLAESSAGVFLAAWAEATPDPELHRALALVASRESTHGEVFRQRIERLGFALRSKENPALEKQVAYYGDPAVSDGDKIARGRRDDGNAADPLAPIAARIDDPEVDPLTRDTLRWYVAEERDTAVLLREAYAAVEQRGK